MSQSKDEDNRRALLAFLERYCGNLTLHEARSLRVESLESLGWLRPDIKDSLTYR
jgi:hypothetical protein